jgi:hypothetical protein
MTKEEWVAWFKDSPGAEHLQWTYTYFAQRLFDRFPNIKVEIRDEPVTEDVDGGAYYERGSEKFDQLTKNVIVCKKAFVEKTKREIIEQTLKHQMVHVWTHFQGIEEEDHGPSFKGKRRRLVCRVVMGFMKHVLAVIGTFAFVSLGIGVLMIEEEYRVNYSPSYFPLGLPLLGGRPIYLGFFGVGILLLGIIGYIMTKSDSTKGSQALVQVQPGNLQISSDPNIRALVNHYNPRSGMFGAWIKRAHGEQRVKLLKILNEEQMLLIQRGAMIQEAVIKGQKSEIEFQKFVAENAAQLYQIRVNEELIRQALEEGLTLQHSQTLRAEGRMSELRLNEERARTQLGLDEEQLRSKIRLDEEEYRSNIKVKEHQRLKEIDLGARWAEIQQDSDAADLAQLGDYLVIKKLRQELREAIEERHAIKTSKRPKGLKAELVADYDNFINRLRAKIDERETGHIPSQNGKEAQGTKAASNSRANYPPASDED